MTYKGAGFEEQRRNIPAKDWDAAMRELDNARRSGSTLAPWSLSGEIFGDAFADNQARARTILRVMVEAKLIEPASHAQIPEVYRVLPRKEGGEK